MKTHHKVCNCALALLFALVHAGGGSRTGTRGQPADGPLPGEEKQAPVGTSGRRTDERCPRELLWKERDEARLGGPLRGPMGLPLHSHQPREAAAWAEGALISRGRGGTGEVPGHAHVTSSHQLGLSVQRSGTKRRPTTTSELATQHQVCPWQLPQRSTALPGPPGSADPTEHPSAREADPEEPVNPSLLCM